MAIAMLAVYVSTTLILLHGAAEKYMIRLMYAGFGERIIVSRRLPTG